MSQASALRRELVTLLRTAAAKSAEWSEAARREWAPHAEEYGKEGVIAPENTFARMEMLLAQSFSGRAKGLDDALGEP